MYILDTDVLQPGDIVLTTQDRKISKGIRRLTGSSFSHALLYVARGSYIHSDGSGVHANNTQRLLFAHQAHALALRLVRHEHRDARPRICDFARSQVGKQYSISQAIASRKHRSGSGGLRENRQFCSRLVAQSFAAADIALVGNPDFCYPTDLFNSDFVAPVADAVREATPAEMAFARTPSPLEAQAAATNRMLQAIRGLAREDVQNEEQLVALLLRRPELDLAAVHALQDSGYLELWRLEVAANPWRYEEGAYAASLPPEARLQEIASADGLLERFVRMRSIYAALAKQAPLKYFAMQLGLHDRLIALQSRRRMVMTAAGRP
ncbi:MAG TPA: YiiX/YebB-like N1pC/P60 family cysteine hydrolase [Ramlibacter sp.]|jgi:hypothetical protein|nr:YiiX/YebB-like N1pC/P60 family cysteine hydrolase [Ramlibacter sp.]